MQLYAFWAVRGYKLGELAALSEGERLFLAAVRELALEESSLEE